MCLRSHPHAARPAPMPDRPMQWYSFSAPSVRHADAPRAGGTQDARFEALVLDFRQALLQRLGEEPEGRARHLRAYVRCVCAQLLYGRQWAEQAAFVLTRRHYKDIWLDFVEEMCANDLVDEGVSWRCRSAVEALWLAHGLLQPLAPERIVMVRENLLLLCESEPGDEPHSAH